ncbi:unnamed protein product [Amoebophrya sp. A25]|nr:unnamed protein product [Amoebophrya sp. A25]|eukprot:GSA25T00020315001.1
MLSFNATRKKVQIRLQGHFGANTTDEEKQKHDRGGGRGEASPRLGEAPALPLSNFAHNNTTASASEVENSYPAPPGLSMGSTSEVENSFPAPPGSLYQEDTSLFMLQQQSMSAAAAAWGFYSKNPNYISGTNTSTGSPDKLSRRAPAGPQHFDLANPANWANHPWYHDNDSSNSSSELATHNSSSAPPGGEDPSYTATHNSSSALPGGEDPSYTSSSRGRRLPPGLFEDTTPSGSREGVPAAITSVARGAARGADTNRSIDAVDTNRRRSAQLDFEHPFFHHRTGETFFSGPFGDPRRNEDINLNNFYGGRGNDLYDDGDDFFYDDDEEGLLLDGEEGLLLDGEDHFGGGGGPLPLAYNHYGSGNNNYLGPGVQHHSRDIAPGDHGVFIPRNYMPEWAQAGLQEPKRTRAAIRRARRKRKAQRERAEAAFNAFTHSMAPS